MRAVIFYREHRDAADRLVRTYEFRIDTQALPSGSVAVGFITDRDQEIVELHDPGHLTKAEEADWWATCELALEIVRHGGNPPESREPAKPVIVTGRLYVYASQADENRRLGTVSTGAPETSAAEQQCVFSGTREQVLAWAKEKKWSLVWRNWS